MDEHANWWESKSSGDPVTLAMLEECMAKAKSFEPEYPIIAVIPPGALVAFDKKYGIKCLECDHECELFTRVLCPTGGEALVWVKEHLWPRAQDEEE